MKETIVEKTVLNENLAEENRIDKEETKEQKEENPYYIEFKKPFIWEGKEYKGVDLTNILDLTARNMIDAENYARKMNVKFNLQLGETVEQTMPYIFFLACRASNLPIEFFYDLPSKDALNVKYRTFHFLLN